MPPRLRPAADLRRPPARGGGVRRRPAARGEAGELDEGRREDREEARLAAVGTKFQEGEKVQCQKVPLEVLRRRLPVYIEGMYWGARTTLAGLVENFHVRSMTDVELEVTPQGTSEESLLKWASGHPGQKIRIHMCGDECAEKLEAEDFIHGVMIQKRSGEDPPWMSNLIEEAPGGEEAQNEQSPNRGGRGRSARRRKVEEGGREERKVRGKGQEEEEKARRRKRQESRQSEGEDRLEGRLKERAESGVRGHRTRPGSQVSPEIRCSGSEEGQEEEKGVIIRRQHKQPELIDFRVHRGLRGATKGAAVGEEGSRAPGCTSHEGDSNLLAHGNRRGLGSRPVVDTALGDAVLPAVAGAAPDWRARARSFDPLLGDRSCPSRSPGGMRGRSRPEAEKCGIGVTGFRMANRAETGGFTSRTTRLIFKRRSKRGNKRTKGRAAHQKRSSEGPQQVRSVAMVRLWGRRPIQRPGLKGKRKEREREGRPKEVEAETMRILSTEEMNLRPFRAPEAGERMEQSQQGLPARQVDDGGSIPTGDGWPSSMVMDLQSKPGETSLMNLPVEKVCMCPPEKGSSLVQVVPWVVDTLVELVDRLGMERQCGTQPKGDVFPLPTSLSTLRDFLDLDIEVIGLVRGICLALNLFYGACRKPLSPHNTTKGSNKILI